MGGFFGGGQRDDGAAERERKAREDADRRRREAEAESRRLTKEKEEFKVDILPIFNKLFI